jgi:IS605 OrfB family transposase
VLKYHTLLTSSGDAVMKKCLPLNLLELTNTKRKLLHETYATYLAVVREVLSSLDGVSSRGQLHNQTYRKLRSKHGIASQLVVEATGYAWNARKAPDGEVKQCVVRFDRRLFRFSRTRRGNPVLTLRTNTKRIGLPVSKDGAYQRLQLHIAQGWELTSIIMKKNQQLLTVLSIETPAPLTRVNWLGADINSPHIAVSIISPSITILKQTYYGKKISTKQFGFEKRRAALQQYRDTNSRSKAGLKLRCLSGRQKNYVRTSIWTLANELVKLAETFNANIAIERLTHLKKRRGQWSRRTRRKVNRIPYGFFGHALRHVAERQRILVSEVNPNYTSQMCPSCGHTSKSNWRNYTYFKCTACGFEANRDRVASMNIALRAAHPAYMSNASSLGLFPRGSVSVSRRVWQGEGFETVAPRNPELQAHRL